MHLLAQHFLSVVSQQPNAVAVREEARAYSYMELHRQSELIAAWIDTQGWKRGDRAVLLFERSFLGVAALLALLRCGVIVLPVDPEDPPIRINDALIMGQNKDCPCKVLSLDCWRHLVATGTELVAIDGRGGSIKGKGSFDRSPGTGAEVAFIFLTSGTSGSPRGVAISNQAILAGVEWARESLELTRTDVHCFKSSFGYVSMLRNVIWPLLTGGSLTIVAPGRHQELDYIASLVERHGVTILIFFPSILEHFLMFANRYNLNSIRHVVTGGGELAHEIRNVFFSNLRGNLTNTYALSEANMATAHLCSPNDAGHITPIGRPIPGVNLVLVDESGNILDGDVEGEIALKGTTLFSWYCQEKNSSIWDQAPGYLSEYFRTGDYAIRREGQLFFAGRRDRRVKVRGHSLEMSEIEMELRKCRGGSGLVVSVAPRGRNADVQVFVERDASTVDVAIALQRILPSVVKFEIRKIGRIPRLFNGKIDYASLEMEEQTVGRVGMDLTRCFRPSRDIAAVCCSVLGLSGWGLRSSFLESGGDSLVLAELLVTIEQEFGVVLDSVDVLQAASMNGVVEVIATKMAEEQS